MSVFSKDFKYIMITSQTGKNYMNFPVVNKFKSLDDFHNRALDFVKELEEYRHNKIGFDFPIEYRFGDFDDEYFSDNRSHYNVNHCSGDIYFNGFNDFYSILRNVNGYIRPADVYDESSGHQNWFEVKEIVEKHFTIV